jgi:hypothetical protein
VTLHHELERLMWANQILRSLSLFTLAPSNEQPGPPPPHASHFVYDRRLTVKCPA